MMNRKSNSIPFHVPKVLYENRYCNQEDFSILISGGRDKDKILTNEVLELEIPSFEVKKFPLTVKPRFVYYLATIKSDIVAICDSVESDKRIVESVVSIEIYSEKSKTWTRLYVEIDERISYCVCSFPVL